MLIFWISAAALLALALAFVLPPLLKKTAPLEDIDHSEVNVLIYKERMAELKQEVEEGTLPPERFEQVKQELEKNLLHDLDNSEQAQDSPPPAARGRWVALPVALLIPLLALGGYWLWGTPAALMLAPQSADGQQQDMLDLESAVARLAERMQQKPEDVQGWRMLARSYMVLENYAAAGRSYAKVLELTGEQDPDALADYAESLGLSGDNQLMGKPLELVNKALALDAAHPKALWLAGMAAAQAGEYGLAIQYLERLQQQFPADSEEGRAVQESLQELRNSSASAPLAETAPSVADTRPPAETAPLAALQVSVNLAPELQAQARPEDTVFVYVRAAQGPRMPLAIVQKQVKDLPITVRLDDSMSMMPGMTLSSFTEIIAAARISKSGGAIAQSGDLLGESTVLTPGAQESVTVTINHSLP